MSACFPLARCLLGSAVLGMQLSMLELLVPDHSSSGSELGIHAVQQSLKESPDAIIETLSGSASASKSIISILLTAPEGYEIAFTNLEWVVLSCAMSFSARVDVMAQAPNIANKSQPLRRRLDFCHTLRQVILRLQIVASAEKDDNGDRDIFHHFLRRARAIESWYLRQTGNASLSTPGSADGAVTREDSAASASASGPPPELPEPEYGGFQDLLFDDFFATGMQNMDFDPYFDLTEAEAA